MKLTKFNKIMQRDKIQHIKQNLEKAESQLNNIKQIVVPKLNEDIKNVTITFSDNRNSDIGSLINLG